MPWNRRTTRRDRKRRRTCYRLTPAATALQFTDADLVLDWNRPDRQEVTHLSLRVEQPRRTMTLVIYDDPPIEHPISEIRELHDIVVNALELKNP